MLHPVGDLAPSVYWRRRILILAAVLLAVVSAYAVFFRSGGDQAPTSNRAFISPGSSATPSTGGVNSTTASTPNTTAASTASGPKACTASQLAIAAASDAKSYPAGAKPKVALLVTNRGPAPCVQDLSDTQIELRIYNGSARVWGSHDCLVQPGSSPSTLPVGSQIRREVEWSGLSSRPGCTGVRTRVSAGTYTLSAYLAGHEGTTVTFSLAG
ncbi:MAG: hypothetical protein M3Y42_14475 [Actinomycetota bacterium]|nr:hypothetical protein [Actinomycetota bacterium]MDQ2958156.1 hypothetical protein [Actinomycetota bacterium]